MVARQDARASLALAAHVSAPARCGLPYAACRRIDYSATQAKLAASSWSPPWYLAICG